MLGVFIFDSVLQAGGRGFDSRQLHSIQSVTEVHRNRRPQGLRFRRFRFEVMLESAARWRDDSQSDSHGTETDDAVGWLRRRGRDDGVKPRVEESGEGSAMTMPPRPCC